MSATEQERLRRWRLVLGGGRADGIKCELTDAQAGMDRTLAALYGSSAGSRGGGQPGTAGLGASSPNVSRWLGDIRTYFPASVVQVMQQDAMDRLGLHQLLLEPEVLEQVQPDVHLGAQVIVLLALSDDGGPMYDHGNAAYFASLGAPAFACTPDQFPDLIAAAIERRDIATWAAKAGVTTSRA